MSLRACMLQQSVTAFFIGTVLLVLEPMQDILLARHCSRKISSVLVDGYIVT